MYNQASMSRPNKKTNTKKQRKYRRKPKTRIMRPMMVKTGQGFPERISTSLKYVERNQHSPASPYFTYLFTANSVFDPRTITGGHQPAYFDQYAAIYKRYIVTGCKITVDINNASTSSMVDCVILHSDSSTEFTDPALIYEQNDAYKSIVVPINQVYPARLTYYVDIAKSFGIKKAHYLADDTFQSLVTTEPNRLSFIHCMFASTNGSSNVAINAVYKVTYYVQFFDRKDIGSS